MEDGKSASATVPELMPTPEYRRVERKVLEIVKRYDPEACLSTSFYKGPLSEEVNRQDITCDVENEIFGPRSIRHQISVSEEESWGTVRGLVEYAAARLGL